jgi:hypothetical protein
MARKIVNRKELRAEAEAAEAADAKTGSKKSASAKAAPKRKSRKKAASEVRLKAFWGVFSQSLKRVATFEYSEKKQAEKKAEELGAGGKSPHFVQLVKEVIEE